MYLISCNEYACDWSDFTEDKNEYSSCPYCDSEDLTIVDEDDLDEDEWIDEDDLDEDEDYNGEEN